MKNFKIKFLGLALAGMVLGACSQMGTYENADLMNEQAEANKAGAKLTPLGSGNENARTYSATNCVDFCIDLVKPEYSMQTATISNNSGPQTRVFTYTVHNTLTGFELAWNYDATNNAARKLRITVSGAGFTSPQTYTSNKVQSAGNGSNSFTFDASWAACGVVNIVAVMLDGNNVMVSAPITTTYGLIGACGGCDESFTYVDNGDKTYTFTYTPEENIANAALVFTFAQGTAISGLDASWSVNGQTRQKTMSLTSCTSYTWTVALNGNCSGNSRSSNVWTDFKVNDVSKKNNQEDKFTQVCD
ncbi:hypothetical protein SAMN03080617_00035 [Algoriphagus alkaliphilus]|uniref:Lipoprotein n=1 Tax=Algoriphagus alkaliphilus TaxID=279824 RepID=A0A1G5UW49_9BACT|nr:hypothetical protein [Algoriphagus alkaliphilus]MBA4300094.1 hypothetical protein [Cyclobacterium sp.]SDA37267.1 hypothetical protein SAMN03080617_00035 [Algoriphagus alkaliphilus]